MLLVALAAGIGLRPSWATVLFALGLGAIMIGAAMAVGRRIRKNERLQVLAAGTLGLLVLPIGSAGGASLRESLAVGAPLCIVYLATTLSVQSILLRARRQTDRARRFAVASIVLAGVSATLGGVLWGAGASWALGLATLMGAAFLVAPPSPRRLKRVGMTVASVQAVAAALLVL